MKKEIIQFKKVMRRFVTGVTVVTTRFEDEYYGLTVNSFTSVSLEPMLVLICIGNDTSSYDALIGAGRFVVSILAEDHAHLSNIFAGAPTAERFLQVPTFETAAGLPVIASALAYLEADITVTVPAGDHTVLIGRVSEMRILNEATQPLLYYEGRYMRLVQALTPDGSA